MKRSHRRNDAQSELDRVTHLRTENALHTGYDLRLNHVGEASGLLAEVDVGFDLSLCNRFLVLPNLPDGNAIRGPLLECLVMGLRRTKRTFS